MEELLELRVQTDFAHLVFRADEGVPLGPHGHVRKIVISTDDPRLPEIIALQRDLRAQGGGRYLVSGWQFIRRYTPAEIAAAELFHLEVSAVFEPAGAECGTVYDTSHACPICGAGRVTEELRLKLRHVPKRVDIANTIASDEWIVNERLATLMQQASITGVELRPVVEASKRGAGSSERWFQLRPMGTRLSFSSRSAFGGSPINVENKYSCPAGDTLGHALISRAYLRPSASPLTDVSISSQFIGSAMGLIVPRPALFISPRLRQLFAENEVRGADLTVAYFDSAAGS